MIIVNDKEYHCDAPKSIVELLHTLSIDADKGTAIAVNNVVIPRNTWNEYLVKDNDKILLIKAAQGG